MKVSAELKNLRLSPRKVRLVAGLVKGLNVAEARRQLNVTVKRPVLAVGKLLKSAIANAENNYGLDKDNLYIFDIKVDEGPKYKRWIPRAYGRASAILKRTSNVHLVLEEVVEGKGRKSKEQIKKERKEREEAKRKMEKELQEEGEKEEDSLRSVKTKKEAEKKMKYQSAKSEDKKGWIKKFFQRKSG